MHRGLWQRAALQIFSYDRIKYYSLCPDIIWLHNTLLTLCSDALFGIVRQLDPVGLQRRTYDLNRKRGEYIVPGPNFIWSIDGHDKLSEWGFEIYGCIDAYSRNILWLYVSISSRTSRPCYSSTLQLLPHTAISQGSYAQTEVKKLILQRRSILRWVVRGKMILISSLETRGSMAPALETSALNRGGRSSRSRSSTLGGFVRHLSVQSTLIYIGLLPESHK
jgi:hypothetical protein